jgi:hypothetical protein
MKRVVETTEDSGFEAMLGENIMVWCGVYIYSGKLTGVNEDHIELADAGVVYETGNLTDKGFQDRQPLPGEVWRVMKAGIESWGAPC